MENSYLISFLTKLVKGEYKKLSELNSTEILLFQLIKGIGLINCVENEDISFENPSQQLMLKSFTEYLRNDIQVITNWEKNKTTNSLLNNGFHFLRESELKRSTLLDTPTPLRVVNICLLVIKSKIKGIEQEMFLGQFNLKTNKIQLIGGYFDESISLETETLRILNKELPGNMFENIKFKKLKEFDKLNVSTKEGIITEYRVSLLSVNLKSIEQIKLKGIDIWLSIDELEEGVSSDGVTIISPFQDTEDREEFKTMLQTIALSTANIQDVHVNQISKIFENSTHKINRLRKILKMEESKNLEFKSSARWDYQNNKLNKNLEKVIVKTIAAMLNSEGGTLVIGLSDDKEILGVKKDIDTLGNKKNIDGYIQHLTNLIISNLGKEFSGLITIDYEEISNKIVCLIDVKPSPTPVFVGNSHEFYIRSSNTTRALSPKETLSYLNAK